MNIHNSKMTHIRNIFEWLLAAMLFAAIVTIVAGLTSCKTCVPIVEVRDSVRVEYKLDSVYVYQHDSIFRDRWRNGDTIFVVQEKWQTRYKDKIVLQHDTIRTNELQVQQVEIVPKFYKGCTIALWVLLALVVIGIAIRIVIKIYLHK